MRFSLAVRTSLALACLLPLTACSKSGDQAAPAAPATAAAPAAPEAGRYQAADFSYVPPSGFTVRDFPGMKYKVVVGTPADGFAPNINVVDEAFSGGVDEYVKRNLETLNRVLPKFEKLAQDEFKTTSGITGARLVTQSVQNNVAVRQLFYMFPAGDKYLVATCSDVQAHKAAMDPICDAAMKTFREP
jgi:hypothetical protein